MYAYCVLRTIFVWKKKVHIQVHVFVRDFCKISCSLFYKKKYAYRVLLDDFEIHPSPLYFKRVLRTSLFFKMQKKIMIIIKKKSGRDPEQNPTYRTKTIQSKLVLRRITIEFDIIMNFLLIFKI